MNIFLDIDFSIKFRSCTFFWCFYFFNKLVVSTWQNWLTWPKWFVKVRAGWTSQKKGRVWAIAQLLAVRIFEDFLESFWCVWIVCGQKAQHFWQMGPKELEIYLTVLGVNFQRVGVDCNAFWSHFPNSSCGKSAHGLIKSKRRLNYILAFVNNVWRMSNSDLSLNW